MQRRWRAGVFVVALYVLLWSLTHFVGGAAVRKVALDAMPVAVSRGGFTDITRREGPVSLGERVYSCRAVGWAPFLVRADYGWGTGPLTGGGGSTLYVWLIGRSFPVYELNHWAQ